MVHVKCTERHHISAAGDPFISGDRTPCSRLPPMQNQIRHSMDGEVDGERNREADRESDVRDQQRNHAEKTSEPEETEHESAHYASRGARALVFMRKHAKNDGEYRKRR